MKSTKIIYWVVTALFALFMIMSGIQNALSTPESIDLISTQLGFPAYFVPMIGVAKILGSIAILIPGFPRIKEWAYAGLFFDLSGATYASIAKFGYHPETTFMFLFIAFCLASYFLYHKVQAQKADVRS
jgi:uncharacterized membrane protein YphA (DoxX/SURF4 family)